MVTTYLALFLLPDLSLLAVGFALLLPLDLAVVGLLSAEGLVPDFAVDDLLAVLSDLPALSDLSALPAFPGLSSLDEDFVAGLSGVSGTLTGGLSFSSARGAAGAASFAFSLSTSRGWPGLLSDFIDIPLASCNCVRDILNLPAMRSGFSPG